MNAPLRATVAGLALLAVGLVFLASENGVFAAEGTSSVDVATASNKVSAAAGMIAMAARSAAPSAAPPAPASVVEIPKINTATAGGGAGKPDAAPVSSGKSDIAESDDAEETVAAIEPAVETAVPPSVAVVPTPLSKPVRPSSSVGSTPAQSVGPGRSAIRPAAERKRNVTRRMAVRSIRVADEDLADGRPRRFLSIPVPIVLGAYR